MDSKTKLRPFYLAKVMYEKTDEDNFLTIAQMKEILSGEYGLDAHRQTIVDDMELLTAFGMDIEVIKSTQNRYHLVSRTFDLPELKLLIDAVESARFITKKKSQELTQKLSSMASVYQGGELVRNIDVEGRIKAHNEKIYLIMDSINTAINEGKKISFQYFAYNVRKERKAKHNGEEYVFSPYKLVWNGDYYYAVGYSDKHEGIGCFRVDRIISSPKKLKEAAVPMPADFDMSVFLDSMFRMYNGPRREVELICDNNVMDAIIDRFGEDVQVYAHNMTSFRIIVNTAVSHVLFSWIFGFGGKVKIKGPEDVKTQYAELVRSAAEAID